MGSKLSSLCQDNSEEKQRDRFLQSTFEKFHCIIDDYDYFFNKENWLDSIPNPLYDADRLMLAYNDYKFQQVKFQVYKKNKKNETGKNG